MSLIYGKSLPQRPLARRGHHRSKVGCMTCKKRRLKCDNKQPICGQCVKSGKQCHRFDDAQHKANIDMLKIGSKSIVIPLAPANQPPQLVSSKEIRDILLHLPGIMEERLNSIKLSTGIPRLGQHVFEYGGDIMAYAEYLPSRAGYDACLDAIITAVALLLRDVKLHQLYGRNNRLQLRDITIAAYTRVLQLLQIALCDQKRSLSAEILCATELLASFEV